MRRRMIGTGLVLASFLLWGLAGAAESGPEDGPRLVHDFFPGEFEPGESVRQLTQLGNTLFFVAQDLETGSKLWRTDGTPGGTGPVRVSGHSGETDAHAIVGRVGRYLLWSSSRTDAPETVSLFSSTERGDGIPLRTYRPRAQDALAITSKRLFFQDCTAAGCSVWSTDGTAAGTQPVRTLAAQFPGASLEIVGTFANRWLLFRVRQAFYAYDFATDRVPLLLRNSGEGVEAFPTGRTLFLRTIHKAAMPDQEMRIWASRLDSPQASLLFADSYLNIAGWRGDSLYFVSANGQLWSTEGRRESTRPYSGIQVDVFGLLADQLGSIGSKTFIPVPGYYWGALLTADERSRKAREVVGVCSGKYSCLASSMSKVVVAGDKAFGEINRRLWQSDGTPQGTRAHEILSQVNVSSFRVLEGRLLVGATSRQGEEQLWETDGTAAGTRALSDGTPDRPFRVEGAPVPLGGALLVPAERKSIGEQLWRVAQGRATPLTSLRHLAAGIGPLDAVPLGDRLLLSGVRSTDWLSLAEDGSTEQIQIYDDCGLYRNPCPTRKIVIGGRLLFAASVGSTLRFTDGTVAGSGDIPLKDANGLLSGVTALGRLGDRALVVGNTGGLWISDGSPSGTRLITQIPVDPQPRIGFGPVAPPVSLGPMAFLFRRVAGPGGPEEAAVLEVWRTDGTAAGTLRLASTPFPKDFAPHLSPAVVGGRLFFRFGGVLWVSDGSAAGTHPLQNQLPGGTFALAAGTDTLYAGAGYQDGDQEHQTLWAIDPATLAARELGTFRQVGGGLAGTSLGNVLGDALFFRAVDEQNAERWWVTEGTASGTHPVPGLQAFGRVAEFITAGDRRYFVACDAEHGCEPWSTDRLGEDTRIERDLWPGPRGSGPQILAVDGDAVWFAATEPSVGHEVWKTGDR